MLKLYLYKIIYNFYGSDISKMKNNNIIKKFYLESIDKDYKTFMNKDETNKFLSQLLLPRKNINKFEKLFLIEGIDVSI